MPARKGNLVCAECGEQKPFCVCEQNLQPAYDNAVVSHAVANEDFGNELIKAGNARLCIGGYGWCDDCGYCRRRKCR